MSIEARFHLSIAAMAVVNMATFAAVHSFTGAMAAAAAGIAVAAAGNFLLGDRLVFAASAGPAARHDRNRRRAGAGLAPRAVRLRPAPATLRGDNGVAGLPPRSTRR
jgi:hypothetical protein